MSDQFIDWLAAPDRNPQTVAELRTALTEANKLLEQTIEVLEGFLGDGPAQMWWRDQAKPLLDNLKAREKNHGSA